MLFCEPLSEVFDTFNVRLFLYLGVLSLLFPPRVFSLSPASRGMRRLGVDGGLTGANVPGGPVGQEEEQDAAGGGDAMPMNAGLGVGSVGVNNLGHRRAMRLGKKKVRMSPCKYPLIHCKGALPCEARGRVPTLVHRPPAVSIVQIPRSDSSHPFRMP